MTKSLPHFKRPLASEVLLETKRLKFVPLCQEHLASLDKNLFSDPEVMRHVYSREYALPRQQFLIAQWQEYGFGFYTLFDKESGELVGRAGVFVETDPEPAIELGYSLAKQFWGKGLATELCACLMRFAFEVLDAQSVVASIKPENVASLRVAEKIGMKNVATFYPAYGGKNYLYKIKKEDYQLLPFPCSKV